MAKFKTVTTSMHYYKITTDNPENLEVFFESKRELIDNRIIRILIDNGDISHLDTVVSVDEISEEEYEEAVF